MKLKIIGLLSLAFAMVWIFFFTPEEASQGIVQKIFYIHVSSAFTMYIAFFISFLSGIAYLFERKRFWDELGVSGVEVGFVFCTIVLITGPIWAKPIWGTFWTWEPRLTTTLLLWMVYAAYLVIRNFVEPGKRREVICSILAIIAFLDVPLIHYSVKLWRGIHPSVINSKSGGLPSSMKVTLAITFVAMVVWMLNLIRMRFNIEKSQNRKGDL